MCVRPYVAYRYRTCMVRQYYFGNFRWLWLTLTVILTIAKLDKIRFLTNLYNDMPSLLQTGSVITGDSVWNYFLNRVPKKSTFYFLNNCQKLTDFNYFGMKIWHENHLTDCPSHLSDVATVPWEIQTSHFQQYYSYILLITYTLSHKKTNCNPLFHPTWKCHHTNLWIAKLFSSDWRFVAFFQTLEILKRAGCGLWSVALKRTGFDVWQLECQASNVIASVQSDHLLH